MTTTVNIAKEVERKLESIKTELMLIYNELWQKSLKFPKQQIKFVRLVEKDRRISKLMPIYMNELNKEVKRLIEDSLLTLSYKTGVKLSSLLNYADIKTLNKVYIGGLDNKINEAIKQTIGAYIFEDDTNKVYQALANTINKNIKQTQILMQEALVTYTRKLNDLAYEKIERAFDRKGCEVLYQYTGVRDSRNSPFCAQHIGQIHTREEWVKIKSDIFINGGHFGCRHSLDIKEVKCE